ncbi:MAG: hypothetical protein ACW99A_18160, partial [Candidatus Kariarchaeaceae archaeon]
MLISSKENDKKRLIFVLIIVFIILIIPFIFSFNFHDTLGIYDENQIDNNNFDLEHPKNQDLSQINTYSGIGAPWNITHWANRTDYNLEASFGNDSYDMVDIPLGGDWEGIKLNSSVKKLYDTRNWVNGSFNYGPDDGINGSTDDDTLYISNPYQSWTFNNRDDYTWSGGPPPWFWFINDFGGNYFDSSTPETDGHNCLELRMNGDDVNFGRYGYDVEDACWGNTSFQIPRGEVVDAELQFDVRAHHLFDLNSLSLRFYLNDQRVFSKNIYHLKQEIGLEWATFKIPMRLWTNTSDIFSNPVNNSDVRLNVSLEYTSYSGWWAGFENVTYQQILIDNIKLFTTAEVLPEQIGLKLNNTSVNDIDWGEGTVELNGNWQADKIYGNFSSDDVGLLSNYTIDLKTDLNLYATKNTPETNYETDYDSIGTTFLVGNNSNVNWESYAYFSVLNGYQETEMRLEFPTDVNITWISEPQDPSNNRLSQCDNSTVGLLIVPVNSISVTPNGYWRIKGVSPNYCNQLEIYKNGTNNPLDNIWNSDNSFLAGDYINITAKILDSAEVTSYLNQTQAQLQIRFPNGTIWNNEGQYKTPDTNGNVYFDYFQIPSLPPYYEVGDYEAIITWNNSYSAFGANETGIIYKKFTVIHESSLEPDQGIFYIENVIDDGITNVKVTYNDKEDYTAIENAEVYTYFNAQMLNFSEISPGFYLLEFNATEAQAGNNTVTIYANSTYYLNNQINITIDVFKETTLTLNTTFVSGQWNQNFTVEFNYTEKNSGNGIDTIPQYNWIWDSYITQTSTGKYKLTCNTSAYEVNQLHSIILDLNKFRYESQTALINIQLVERKTNLEVFLNGTKSSDFIFYNLSIGMSVNFTAIYTDNLTSDNIDSAMIDLIGTNISKQFTLHPSYKQYNLTISAEYLGLGAKFLTISAQKANYTSLSEDINMFINERATVLELIINGTQKLEHEKFIAQVGEFINITIKFKDFLNDTHLPNANITLLGEGELSENNPLEYYNISLFANDLDQRINIFTILAQKEGYEVKTIQFIVEIVERKTELKVFINGTEIQFIDLPISTDVNITVKYLDNQTKAHIINATVQIFGEGFDQNLTESFALEQYTYIIDKAALDIGDRFLTIFTNKTYYQTHSPTLKITIRRIQIIVDVGLEEDTVNVHPGDSYNLQIELNNDDFGGNVEGARVIYTWAFGQGELTDPESDGVYEVRFENIPEGVFTVSITVYAG